MKKFYLLILSVMVLTAAAGPKSVYTNDDFRRITAMTARVLDRNHYSATPMSIQFSSRIFDNFVNDLDSEKLLFAEEDIKEFSAERPVIGFKLQEGDCSLAFRFYELFRKRYTEYREFSRKFLNGPIDFTVDERYDFDRKRALRVKSRKELPELWRRKLKHQMLVFKLIEEPNGNEEKTADKKQQKQTRKTPVKTPAERILQSQRDFGNAIEKREKIDILGILLNAMAGSYGAHSAYNPPKLSEDFDIHMSLSLTGIGATLTSENGYVKVVELVPGGPAAKSGKLKINDRLIRVTQENGESVDLIDMPVSQAVTYIRGAKDSKVTLDVLSGDSVNPTRITLIRDKINLEESAAQGVVKNVILPGGKSASRIGVITLPGFYMDFDAAARDGATARRASTDVRRIVEKFKSENVDAIVFDLRRNGGGSLPDAVVMAGLFLKGGPVVRVEGKSGSRLLRDEDDSVLYDGPMVVLTSKMSASAAEIFAAALRDSSRAVMVGDSRTFGKSTVLNVENLSPYNALFRRVEAGSLIFESAMFYRINGSSVQQLGVQPDIVLPSLSEEMEIGEMYAENHLPWDSTGAARFTPFDRTLAGKIPLLREHSQQRVKENSAYSKLLAQIALYRKMRNRKSASLNEAVRKQEYQNERKMLEAADKLIEENRQKSGDDPVLTEAVNIAAELYLLNSEEINPDKRPAE